MRRTLGILALAGVLVGSSACSTITIREKTGGRLSSEPTYQASKSFWLWGLVGEHHIDVNAICGKRPVQEIQAQDTFLDGLVSVLTIGIYQPRSVKVWCGNGKRS